MKKVLYLLMMCAGLVFTSCEKDEAGSTATAALAGDWYVTVDAVDANGNVFAEDFFEIGHTHLITYNTASNIPTEMYVSDLGYFWEYTIRVNCDVNSLTFSSNGAVKNEDYDCMVTLEDGKILMGAATTPSGMPADSIVFYVSFSDDEYPAAYGYSKYKVSGYRYTGLAADD